MTGNFLYFFQQGNSLPGQWYEVWSVHFGSTTEIPDFVNGLAGAIQMLFLKSISLQRAKRSSLERINKCRVNITASRVNSRPC